MATDRETLRFIFRAVVPIESERDGMLTMRFKDGTRLALCCGPSGRLNMVVIQHGPDTPELRLPDKEPA